MIRVATAADAVGIARVHVATWRTAYADLLPAAVLAALSVPANASRWAGLLADPATRTWVAERDGEVVGFVSAGPPRDADLPPSVGEVYAAYVLPSAQRGGLGRGLLDAARGWFAAEGRTGAALWVLTGNTAGRLFYEACGWRWDGRERAIDVGGAVVDEVRYLELTEAATSIHLAR